jgi:hypothetical protein
MFVGIAIGLQVPQYLGLITESLVFHPQPSGNSKYRGTRQSAFHIALREITWPTIK